MSVFVSHTTIDCHDAFGLSDLTEVTKKYSLEALQSMERAAIKHVQLTRPARRRRP